MPGPSLVSSALSPQFTTVRIEGTGQWGDRFMRNLGELFMLSCERVKPEHSPSRKDAPHPTKYFTEDPTLTGFTRPPSPSGGESRLYPATGQMPFPSLWDILGQTPLETAVT